MNAYKRGVRLTLTISPQVSAAIDNLIRHGLYGRTRAEVAQRLLYAEVREVASEVLGLEFLPVKGRRK